MKQKGGGVFHNNITIFIVFIIFCVFLINCLYFIIYYISIAYVSLLNNPISLIVLSFIIIISIIYLLDIFQSIYKLFR